MTLLNELEWRPSGINDLEPRAWEALKHKGNMCIIAGPGAGKTELLAQRAAYLLQTGLCPEPHRILAISFKKDAAKNLAARVHQRCHAEQARRFCSMTFDAFTKGLVDRFQQAIPDPWQPTRQYEIGFPGRRDYEDFLTRSRLSAPEAWQTEIAGVSPTTFEQHIVSNLALPDSALQPCNKESWLVQQWWKEHLKRPPVSSLTFVMINRLAELLMRSNKHILRALRITYPFVFLDEFQDTTFAQYGFLFTAFRESDLELTAVGDDKQRIMVWAGARSDAFRQFQTDFNAQCIPLTFNYRSSPSLVRIQGIVAGALEEHPCRVVSQVEAQIEDSCADIWKFRNEDAEARHISSWISEDKATRGLTARDYCILVRQTADRFENQLHAQFMHNGLLLRNESKTVGKTTLQDLVAEELTLISVAIFRLATEKQSPKSWGTAVKAIEILHNVSYNAEETDHRVQDELSTFINATREITERSSPSAESVGDILNRIFEFLDLGQMRQAYPCYATGDSLKIACEALLEHLGSCAEASETWVSCLDMFEGVGQIPLMTIHKSKGLEYDTVIFMGLDDSMWWSHQPGEIEGTSTFFVGLSRAKQRVIFTNCEDRGEPQKVKDLYEHLRNAGVSEKVFS